MIVSPMPSQISQQKCFPMKTKVCEDNSYGEVKKNLVENTEEENGLLSSIYLKFENFDSRQAKIITLLVRIASDQAKLVSLMTPQPHSSYNALPAIFIPFMPFSSRLSCIQLII